MTSYIFDESSTSSVAGAVTLLASAWFLVAAVAMMAAPTDTAVARASSVSVKPLGVVLPQTDKVAATPDARFSIAVTARRA